MSKNNILSLFRKIQADLEASNGNASEERIKLLAGLTRLRQICCDPSLLSRIIKVNLVNYYSYLIQYKQQEKTVNAFSYFPNSRVCLELFAKN